MAQYNHDREVKMRVIGLWLLTIGCGWKNAPFPQPPAAVDGEVRRSNLTIPAGQTFELGGRHTGRIDVRVHNVGRAAIEVLTERGDEVAVAPDATIDAAFGPGVVARLQNGSTRTARLKVLYVQSDSEFLGMRYVDSP